MSEFVWPDGKRCAVALTFDMDGETVPFVLDPPNARRRLSLMSEAMYDARVGTPRILDMLERAGLRSTFFVPSFVAELHPDLLREVVARGNNVGCHGYMHERPDSLTDEQEEQVLVRSKQTLTEILGSAPVGYRSPSWELKPTTPALLARHGFLYDSSLMGDDVPYRVAAGDGDLIELPPQWLLDDFPLFGFSAFPPIGNGISDPDAAFSIWSKEFEGLHRFGGICVMTFHPYVSGRPSRIALIERLVEHMKSFDGVWFATLEEIAAHCAEGGHGELVAYHPAQLAE